MDLLTTTTGILTLTVCMAVGALAGYVGYRLALRSRATLMPGFKDTRLWRPSRLEQRWFNSTTIVVDRQGVDVESLLGVDLDDEQIKLLSGAPSDSTVTLEYRGAADWARHHTGADQPPPGLYFFVSGPCLVPHGRNVVGLYRDHQGAAGLYLKDILLGEAMPAGAAGRMLIRMARAGAALGVQEMRLLAAGGRNWPNWNGTDRWKGYAAWPTYGFNMPLLAETLDIIRHFPHHPADLARCYTVRDVLAKPDGALFWRLAGDGWFMTFNLSSDKTVSVQTLLAKTQMKEASAC